MAVFFTASQDAQAITTAVDLLFCTVAADKPVTLWGLDIANTTDLGDANEEVLKIGIYTGVTGGGSGTALTENCTWDVPGTTAGAAWVGQATASTGGTLRKTIYWNVRQAGPAWVAIHELATVRCNAANDPIAFRLLAAPADSITLSYEVIWSEV